jgi:hypothetical protein
MKKEMTLMVMSMNNSPRLPILIKRLKELNLKYKIFNGLYGENQRERNEVYKYYDREAVIKRTSREMGFNEIGGCYTFLKVLKYCLKKKIENAILMNDDHYPSLLFKEWVKKKVYFKGKKIIGFCCTPPGFLKKNYETALDGKVKIHEAKTHLFNSGCSQVTIGFIKKFLKVTKNKVIGNGDYPIDFRKYQITMLQTVPFLTYPDDRGFSFLSKDRDKLEKTYFKNFRKLLVKKIGIELTKKLLNFFRIFYYILFIPFILRKYKNFDYYLEYYFEKQFCKIKNFFINCYIDIDKIYALKTAYAKGLKKYAKHYV